MALERHDDADRGESAGSAADCGPCGRAESGTRARRVLFVVCARTESPVARFLVRLKERPPENVLVELCHPDDVRAAKDYAREHFSGEPDRVVVVIHFDSCSQNLLIAAQEFALSHPVLAFIATSDGGEAEIAFKRRIEAAGHALGRFTTCHLGQGECMLRSIRQHLLNECQR